MKIDFNQTFKGIAGPGSDGLTLAIVAVQALNAQSPAAKEPLPLEEAMKRGMLALKVMDGGEHDLSVEDVAKIRQQLPLAWTPIIVAQAAGMLG